MYTDMGLTNFTRSDARDIAINCTNPSPLPVNGNLKLLYTNPNPNPNHEALTGRLTSMGIRSSELSSAHIDMHQERIL